MDEKKTAWERLQLVHTKGRPTVRDYIPLIFTDFYELHGDRHYGDDMAILGGIGRLDGRPVTIIGQVKGRDLDENKACNFAMPHPEGYRKALRLAKQAESSTDRSYASLTLPAHSAVSQPRKEVSVRLSQRILLSS